MSHSDTTVVHKGTITAGQAEAVWTEKFVQHFYAPEHQIFALEFNALS